MSTRTIEIAPLAYMRGRTLDNAFIILDEAQNTNDLQLKMFLTRIGANAKAIITGDPTQVDLPKNQRSGLEKACRILKKSTALPILNWMKKMLFVTGWLRPSLRLTKRKKITNRCTGFSRVPHR